TADGRGKQASRATRLEDSAENRRRLAPLVEVIGAVVRARKDPGPQLDEALGAPARRTAPATQGDPATVEPTVAAYFEQWIEEQTLLVRKAQARDYRRHVQSYVLPRLGGLALRDLRPRDIRGLQRELLARGLSVKTVKNAISGSLRAMVKQAEA